MSKKSFEKRKNQNKKKLTDKSLEITLIIALINLITAIIELINKLLK